MTHSFPDLAIQHDAQHCNAPERQQLVSPPIEPTPHDPPSASAPTDPPF
jgi:hypothetical protein